MNTPEGYRFLADLVLICHTLFIVFVIVGFLLILIGLAMKWSLVDNFWFRATHLLAIISVTIWPLTNQFCPLTVWESRLRAAAGDYSYQGGFLQHWIHQIIYYDFPLWVFSILYVLFALIVIITWVVRPPRRPKFLCSK